MAQRDLKRGARFALVSGMSLLESATILQERERHSHAFALAMMGIEELAKAEIYAMWLEGVKSIPNLEALLDKGTMTSDTVSTAVLDHSSKYRRFAYYLRMSQVVTLTLGISEARRLGYVATTDEQLLKAGKLDSARQDAIYVDFRHGRWTTPSRFQPEDADFLLVTGSRYAKWLGIVLENGWKETTNGIYARIGLHLDRT